MKNCQRPGKTKFIYITKVWAKMNLPKNHMYVSPKTSYLIYNHHDIAKIVVRFTRKNPKKKSKIARKSMILSKQRKIWILFFPRSNKNYKTVGCTVVSFSRSAEGGTFWTKVLQNSFRGLCKAWVKLAGRCSRMSCIENIRTNIALVHSIFALM